ncbi:sugar phosphate isomerase/epimerase family protein [Deinococcus sp.]|uniref:sugar phosphate isomerase/epimerase family protein n=1 Tax=Deinococcus sp. TaxID=47478 RepID=UPI0025E62D7E|nr:sugar phosphate isomerase/epimerase family protein [Deinococcus sp.]
MIKFGAHAFSWESDWTTATLQRVIGYAADAGLDFIEIPLLRPGEFEAAEHRALLEERGLAAVCSLSLPKWAHMPTHPHEAERFLSSVLDRMEQLGSHYLTGCTAYALGVLTGAPPTPGEYAVIAETLTRVAEDAKRRGVVMGLEACNRYETYLFNTLADVSGFIDGLDTDNLHVHADTYHMNIEEEGFRAALIGAGQRLQFIHMSESHRGLVGTGNVHWEEVWAGLAAIQFSGYLTLESFAAPNADLAAATCIWKPARYSGQQLAEGGLKFLRAGAIKSGLMEG